MDASNIANDNATYHVFEYVFSKQKSIKNNTIPETNNKIATHNTIIREVFIYNRFIIYKCHK
jgi:hypothetical protein